MNITIWDLFKYVYKWKAAIIGVVVVSLLTVYVYVNRMQTYNSTVILNLTDLCISNGEAPDGTTFDINEIVSPNVMTDVIEELKLDMTVDELRSGIVIEPIIPNSEAEIRTSKEELGEKYEYFPNTFLVSYTGDVGETTNNVRDILEAITNNYIEFYNEKYLQLASINDIAYDEDMGDYDYIDMADMISENLDDIISSLSNYHESHASFRSNTTGYTFSDLVKEYNYINDFDISQIYSDIFRGQITKNKDKLIKTYTQKKEEFILERNNFLDLAYVAKTRMDTFSVANKDVPNAYNNPTNGNNDDLAIIEGVHDKLSRSNTTTTYDDLINNYVRHNIAANDAQLNANRCDEIISEFTSPVEENLDYSYIEQKVAHGLENARLKISDLNKTVNMVIEDYNDYSATSHVKPLTGVNYYATLSFSLYAFLTVTVSGLFALIFAVAYEIIKAIKKENSEV